MRTHLIAVSLAALIAATACNRSPDQLGDQAAENVEPKEVSASELRAAVADPRVRAFYEARGWKAAWNEDQAKELTEALREAPRHGLEAVKFLREGDAAADPVTREAKLSLAAVSYADALANGQVDPGKLFEVYSVPRPRVNVVQGLNQAIGGGDVGKWLASLAPQDAEYRALSDAFVRYSQAARGKAPQVPAGEALKPGDRDPRVPQIAEALRINGYLEAPQQQQQGARQKQVQADATRYTPELVAGVKRLQQDYGQNADGVIGKDTLQMLNTGAAERARTLAINLERRRWLERTPPATRIDVNTAAAFLHYFRDGNLADTRRVVVGQQDWETPQLGSPIMRLVANPPWNVPESIEKDELAGKSAAYFAANNFVRKEGRWVQQPGPDTALGLVKFDMDNPHAIYLHDTPAKTLFGTNDRHASHGCVRVHNAVQFAQLLAGHDGKGADFQRALASGKESPIELKTKIPVRLLYHTAYVENGRVVFRADPYGWDEGLAGALGMEKRPRQKLRTHISVSGP
ncbi:MAG TPA: L,D-transpeptidase family protein [Allosphingosinicella sp.]|uniref:L,D-transpeptidase family protein n=1 Tax=Allosphingosinicella sp. TaxID=2823234 RepID=UPI002EDA0337